MQNIFKIIIFYWREYGNAQIDAPEISHMIKLNNLLLFMAVATILNFGNLI